MRPTADKAAAVAWRPRCSSGPGCGFAAVRSGERRDGTFQTAAECCLYVAAVTWEGAEGRGREREPWLRRTGREIASVPCQEVRGTPRFCLMWRQGKASRTLTDARRLFLFSKTSMRPHSSPVPTVPRLRSGQTPPTAAQQGWSRLPIFGINHHGVTSRSRRRGVRAAVADD